MGLIKFVYSITLAELIKGNGKTLISAWKDWILVYWSDTTGKLAFQKIQWFVSLSISEILPLCNCSRTLPCPHVNTPWLSLQKNQSPKSKNSAMNVGSSICCQTTIFITSWRKWMMNWFATFAFSLCYSPWTRLVDTHTALSALKTLCRNIPSVLWIGKNCLSSTVGSPAFLSGIYWINSLSTVPFKMNVNRQCNGVNWRLTYKTGVYLVL